MLNLERLGTITSELSSNLIKSLVLPSGLLGRRRSQPAAMRTESRTEESGKPYLPAGCVILAGGLPLPDDVVIAVIHAVGSRKLRVAVLPVGVDPGSIEDTRPQATFKRYGIHRIELVSAQRREEAQDPAQASRLLAADVVMLCGDNPRQARALLSGTACGNALGAALAAGKVVVAAGAAAAVMAERMVMPGEGDTVAIESGLGLLPCLVLPAGLDGRDNHQKLMHAVGCRLGARYLGLELGGVAGAVIYGNEARVVGDGSVSFLDGRDATRSPGDHRSAYHRPADDREGTVGSPDDEVVCGLKVHVLVAGYGLNLKTRRPLAPPREGTQSAGG